MKQPEVKLVIDPHSLDVIAGDVRSGQMLVLTDGTRRMQFDSRDGGLIELVSSDRVTPSASEQVQ